MVENIYKSLLYMEAVTCRRNSIVLIQDPGASLKCKLEYNIVKTGSNSQQKDKQLKMVSLYTCLIHSCIWLGRIGPVNTPLRRTNTPSLHSYKTSGLLGGNTLTSMTFKLAVHKQIIFTLIREYLFINFIIFTLKIKTLKKNNIVSLFL